MIQFFTLIPLLFSLSSFALQISKIDEVELQHERMALQAVKMKDGKVALLGGYTYPTRDCVREVSLLTPEKEEISSGVFLPIGKNHFRSHLLEDESILVLAGFHENFGSLASVEKINFQTKKVEASSWLGLPIELFSSIDLGEEIAVIGGLTAQGMQTWDVIQIVDKKTGEVGFVEKRLSKSRFGHESILDAKSGNVFIFGGKNVRIDTDWQGKRSRKIEALKEIEIWEPSTGEVISGGSLLEARDRPAVFRMKDGKILIIGGASAEPESKKLKSIELYDPETKTSKKIADLNHARMATTVLPYKDQGLLIAGGWVDEEEHGKALEYLDFESMKVSVVGSLNHARAEHQMLWTDEQTFLMVGGKNHIGQKDPHSYEFKAAEWVTLED